MVGRSPNEWATEGFFFNALKVIREVKVYDGQKGRGSEQNMSTRCLVPFRCLQCALGDFKVSGLVDQNLRFPGSLGSEPVGNMCS